MSTLVCSNCEKEFRVVKTYFNVQGYFAVCPTCGMIADASDIEVELSEEEAKQCDKIYNAVYVLCQAVTGTDYPYGAYPVSAIAEKVTKMLASDGSRVNFPAVVTKKDGSQYVRKYVTGNKIKKRYFESVPDSL